jgi:hypothetical protein
MHKVPDFIKVVESFKEHVLVNPDHRYRSFDFCYLHFHPKSGNDILAEIEKSSLVIGFYLASWGMMRGSSFLLQKNASVYIPLIKYIASIDKGVWEIDVDSYSKDHIDEIIEIYDKVRKILMPSPKTAHLTLITKLLLGVFGFIPAFDRFFINTFSNMAQDKSGFRSVSPKTLNLIKEFYYINNEEIQRFRDGMKCVAFDGSKTDIDYPLAKIVDMYGFNKSFISKG